MNEKNKYIMKSNKITWLAFINYYILQWFFIRLARVGYMDNKGKFKQTGWKILKWIVPMSGYNNDYRKLQW